LTTALDTYRDRRAVRARYKTAERELSTYTTPADLQELDAMLERSAGQDITIYSEIIERIRFRSAA